MMKDKSTDELVKLLWDYNRLNRKLEKADCILTLGSHDLRVAEKGAKLLLDRFAPLIIFSGGIGRLTESWQQSEAESFAKLALIMGVPIKKILIEKNSTNTGENISYSFNLLQDHGIVPKKIILVTKPYMERRAYATAKKLFPSVRVIPTSPQISFEDYPTEKILKEEMINIIVGDTQRIKLYPDKGFMIEQKIPAKVWQAYEELVKRGFTQHLVKL